MVVALDILDCLILMIQIELWPSVPVQAATLGRLGRESAGNAPLTLKDAALDTDRAQGVQTRQQ